MRRSVCTAVAAAAIGIVCPEISRAQSNRPMMSRDLDVECYQDKAGDVWRVQCNPMTRVCLYAADSELSTSGSRTKPLERARTCPAFSKDTPTREQREAQGYAFVQGRPGAPYGWTRDDRNRVFQVNFDLKRRMYVGASYAPEAMLDGTSSRRRTGADFGLFVFEHYGGASDPNRHRIRIAEGEVFLDPFSAEIVLAHYDLSRRFLEPLLRITTFLGSPRRHDLRLNIGLWGEAGHLEAHPGGTSNANLWRFATAQATLDLWQSPQLDSFARVRTGVGVERLYIGEIPDRTAVTFGSAFEVDWVADKSGFHNVRAEVKYEKPNYVAPQPLVGDRATRFQARLRYEAILVAVNDQPVSLRLDAGGEKRNDIPGLANEWAFVANAGLRFSLWAPPRSP